MKNEHNVSILIMIIIINTVAASFLGAQGSSAPAARAEAAGVIFELRFDGDEVEITLKAKTAGWVAYGLEPSRRMKDADIVIAFVKDGKAFARDDYGTSDIAHRDDAALGGSDGVLSVRGTESGGETTVVLRLARYPDDGKDKAFVPGRRKLILARGARDDFASKHVAAATVEIDIPSR